MKTITKITAHEQDNIAHWHAQKIFKLSYRKMTWKRGANHRESKNFQVEYNKRMSSKTIIYGAMFVGSMIGGYIPTLWGAGAFSISSLVCSGIGAIVAIVISIKFL